MSRMYDDPRWLIWKSNGLNTLRKLNRGEIREPKFTTGVRLIDAHFDACPTRHRTILQTGIGYGR